MRLALDPLQSELASWTFRRCSASRAIGPIAKTETSVQTTRMSIVNHVLPVASVTACGKSPVLKIRRFP